MHTEAGKSVLLFFEDMPYRVVYKRAIYLVR